MKDRAQAVDKPMVEHKPREERIRNLAYQRFLARDGVVGNALKDWLEAEAEIDDQDHQRLAG